MNNCGQETRVKTLSQGPPKLVKMKKVLSIKMANISVGRSAEKAHNG